MEGLKNIFKFFLIWLGASVISVPVGMIWDMNFDFEIHGGIWVLFFMFVIYFILYKGSSKKDKNNKSE